MGLFMYVVVDNQNAREMNFEGSVSSLLRHLNIMREEVIIKLNGKLAPETSEVKGEDIVEIIKVVFGG